MVRIEMQLNLSSFGSVLANPFVFNGYLIEGTESSGVSFLVPFLLFQVGAMDLSKVSEKILSSIRCARSLGLLPSASDRPEVMTSTVLTSGTWVCGLSTISRPIVYNDCPSVLLRIF